MNGHRARHCLVLLLCAATLYAQEPQSKLEGMWSDPPTTPEDIFCFFTCTDVGLEYLAGLLNDPANDARPYPELRAEAVAYEEREYVRPRLSAAALETYPLDELADPGYLDCEPWGLARQVFAPHQLQIRHFPDRIEMRYGEWDARRVVLLAGALPSDLVPSLLGYSVASYEGDALVIRTSGIRANITSWRAKHSDRLAVTERYVRDGDRLLMTATLTDPWGLREPVELKKVWGWAPDQEIFPYVDCERPDQSSTTGD